MTPDIINGFFEGGLAVMLVGNIRQLIQDKKVSGVRLAPSFFVTAWSFWNLAYYPVLHQWVSLVGGIGVVIANCVWLALALHYRRVRRPE